MALKIVGCLSMSTIEKRCVTIPEVCVPEVCVHVHMSDNREMMSETVNSWLPVDVDNRETLCDDKSGLHTCSHGR